MSTEQYMFSIIIPHRHQEAVDGLINRIKKLSGASVEVFAVSGNQPSYQRNMAAKKAAGKFIYFLDNDAFPAEENLELIENAFKNDQQLAVVGGPSLTPEEDTSLQKAFGYVLGSFFGTVFIHARYASFGQPRYTTDKELILCNLVMRKDIFLELGGFNEQLYPNEENELMDRILESGYTMLHHPGVTVTRTQRPTWKAFFKQLFTYGRGRSEQMRGAFSLSNLPVFVFMFFPVYFFSLPFLFLLDIPLLAGGAGLYLVAAIFSSISAFKLGIKTGLAAIPAFFLCHFCYGLGMWKGLLFPLHSKKITPKALLKRVFSRKKRKKKQSGV